VARAVQELRAPVDRAVVRRAHVDGRVQVVAYARIALAARRLDALRLAGRNARARALAALVLAVDEIIVLGIGERPHAVAAVDVDPRAVGNAAAAARGRHPRAVVLQPA